MNNRKRKERQVDKCRIRFLHESTIEMHKVHTQFKRKHEDSRVNI